MYSQALLQAIPKSDLHVHLDGSLRPATLIELAREQGVPLPSYSEAGLMELVFKEQYQDLVEYLQGFAYTVAVMQDPESLERIAYEFALDNAAENVRYVEVRFAPQLHVHPTMDMEAVLAAVDKGLERAKKEINRRKDGMPPFEYGIIVCNLRFFTDEQAWYYKSLFTALPYADKKEVFSLASLQLARAAVDIRDRKGAHIVGLDLAGAEAGYPAVDHSAAFQYAHNNFLKKTVHAGEAYGAESIFQAITALHADRIGHGLLLFDEEQVTNPEIRDKKDYIRKLAGFIADRRITVEVCLTSNGQTCPALTDISRHSLGKMLEHNLSVTLCTDNRLVSRTSVTKELQLAVDNFSVPPAVLRNLIIYGFKRSFFPGNYTAKRRYVRQVIDYYENVCREHGIDPKGQGDT